MSAPSLSLKGASVGFLEDSSSEVNRGSFGLSLIFFADGVTLLFFDAEGSCHLLLEDVCVILCPVVSKSVSILFANGDGFQVFVFPCAVIFCGEVPAWRSVPDSISLFSPC
jgi:hypothetical protein